MKKFFMIAVMAVAALSANAQVIDQNEANEKGKFHLTPMIGLGYDGFLNADNYGTGIGAVVRGEFEYMAAKNFGIGAGLEYEYRCSESYEGNTTTWDGIKVNGESHHENEFLNIPVMLQYHVGGFAVKAGFQPCFLLYAKNHIKATASSGNASASAKENISYKDDCKTTQFAIPVGLSYTFRVPVTIDLRCAIPVTQVADNPYDGRKLRHLSVMLSVGYRFFR